MYEPAAGRFSTLDPFFGNRNDPQSLHKYAYVHGDPVNGIDPTGEFFTLIGLMAGFKIRSISETRAAPVMLAKIGFAADVFLAGALIYGRHASKLYYEAGTFIPVDKAKLESHYHSVKIRRSAKTADEIFAKMSRFTELNTYPARALQNATAIDDVITWDMSPIYADFAQADFDVKVTRRDAENRTFVVRTLAGHPLAGWRLWRVRELPEGEIIIETFSVEHHATLADFTKLYIGGLKGMYNTWTNMLKDLIDFSSGVIVNDDDTVLKGEDRTGDVANYLLQVR